MLSNLGCWGGPSGSPIRIVLWALSAPRNMSVQEMRVCFSFDTYLFLFGSLENVCFLILICLFDPGPFFQVTQIWAGRFPPPHFSVDQRPRGKGREAGVRPGGGGWGPAASRPMGPTPAKPQTSGGLHSPFSPFCRTICNSNPFGEFGAGKCQRDMIPFLFLPFRSLLARNSFHFGKFVH